MGSNVQIGPQTLKLQLDQIFVLTISQRLCSSIVKASNKEFVKIRNSVFFSNFEIFREFAPKMKSV